MQKNIFNQILIIKTQLSTHLYTLSTGSQLVIHIDKVIIHSLGITLWMKANFSNKSISGCKKCTKTVKIRLKQCKGANPNGNKDLAYNEGK
ncbi:hypothetical protein [Listeria rustica]|uniref:Uncharacterized protein n=1 Tax=Listeria rustica TaxID=2713503 RepID=A0A7W1T5Z8_9LIST|nr:hypothetical protein [Listeria rustica]MBA3926141.1 hypothetical protein [Listeria rustica]